MYYWNGPDRQISREVVTIKTFVNPDPVGPDSWRAV